MKPTMKKLAVALAVVLVLAAAYCLGGPRGAAPSAVPPPSASQEVPSEAGPAETPERQAPEPQAAKEPAPADAPLPADPAKPEAPAAEAGAEQGGETEPAALTCTLSIRCDSILAHPDLLDEAKAELAPADGVLLAETEAVFSEGESAFDLLLRETRSAGLHLEYVSTPGYQSAYIEGIGNLYEFDCGPLSGWVYSVNGDFPNYGSSRYTLQDGDTVLWQYTCDLGADVGGDNGAWS